MKRWTLPDAERSEISEGVRRPGPNPWLLAAVVAAPGVLLGGCLAAVVYAAHQPPGSGIFEPLPDGVTVVDEYSWCEPDRPGHWDELDFNYHMCVTEVVVNREGMTPDDLAEELRAVYRARHVYWGNTDRVVAVVPSPGPVEGVSLVHGEGN